MNLAEISNSLVVLKDAMRERLKVSVELHKQAQSVGSAGLEAHTQNAMELLSESVNSLERTLGRIATLELMNRITNTLN